MFPATALHESAGLIFRRQLPGSSLFNRDEPTRNSGHSPEFPHICNIGLLVIAEPTRQAQLKPLLESGSERIRLPVTAKMALVSAGIMGGSAGSQRPVGGLLVVRKCTSISGGA